MNKWIYILGAMVIAGFALLGAMELQNAQTPCVTTVAEARSVQDRPIQFLGTIVSGKTSYDESAHELLFAIRGTDGKTLDVRYEGVKPANFDIAEKAVVRGTYRGGELVANQVMLERPSKHRGR